jgi:hypothetical protein
MRKPTSTANWPPRRRRNAKRNGTIGLMHTIGLGGAATTAQLRCNRGTSGLWLKTALITHPAKHVLGDFESVNLIDTSACDVMLTAIKELQDQGVTVAFARVRDEVRERMRLTGIEATVGANYFYERVTDGVRACPGYQSAP